MVFGFFAVAQIGALLEVSLMWADVYSKSVKMGAQDNTIANLTKLVGSLIVMTFVIVMGGLLLGKSTIAAGWIILLLISVAGAYFRGGSQLARILAPANPDAPGADSAKAASDEIKTTAVYIPIYNVGFFFGLVGYSITVQRPLTGPVSFICVTTFLQCASFHQMRLLYYCRFGARKKLAKAGYKGFRSSLMSTMSSSSVEPEDSDSRGK
jgi:hypothetical protein